MKFNRTALNEIIIFIFFILLSNNISAQSEESLLLEKEHNLNNGFNFSTVLYDLQPNYFESFSIFNRNISFLELYQLSNPTKKSVLFKNISFSQNKTENIFPNLGVYQHFNNSFNYTINDKIIVYFGIGLVKQNTILTSNYPNYQFSFHTSVEYAITNWLSAYIAGQYLTPPINKSKDFFDPFIYRNPLFLQTEIGSGIKAKYKNIKADIGVKVITSTQFKQSSPIGTMNSKVTIGF